MRIDAVCVTYNPDKEKLIACVSAVTPQVHTLWIVDNSDYDPDFSDIENHFENARILRLGSNRGIAFALNRGCELAISEDAEWLLTLDQDSVIPPNMITQYCNIINDGIFPNIGIITCNIICCESDKIMKSKKEIEVVKQCWTSGSLMNLKAYKTTKGFFEELFIDGVDFAYCYSLREKNYEIVRHSKVDMQHQLGESKSYYFLKKHLFYVTNHNPIRWYYMVRNSLWISEKFSSKFRESKFTYFNVFKYAVKITFFEKDKLNKYKMIVKGIKDFTNNKLGKLQR